MRRARCVDRRPARQSPEAEHRPQYARERWDLLEKYGSEAFLMPEGTLRKDLPAYPVVSKKTGCFHCGMMRMAYTRIGGMLNRSDVPEDYRRKLVAAREKLISIALGFADARDRSNRCNFALRAARKYLR